MTPQLFSIPSRHFAKAKIGIFQTKAFSKSQNRVFSDQDILQKLESGFFSQRHLTHIFSDLVRLKPFFGFFQGYAFCKSYIRVFSDTDILQKLDSCFLRPRHFAEPRIEIFQTKAFSKSQNRDFSDQDILQKLESGYFRHFFLCKAAILFRAISYNRKRDFAD